MKKRVLLLLILKLITPTTAPPSINKPSGLSIPLYLSSLDKYDCFEKTAQTAYNSLCLNKLQNAEFSALSKISWGHEKLFDFFNNEIYKPIAYNIKKKSSMSEVITDLYNANESNSLLDSENLNVNYEDFEEEILKTFQDLENNVEIGEEGQKMIKKNIVDILRNFHVYWNSLRLSDQVRRVKTDTKSVMGNLLGQNEVKEKFLFDITKTLVLKIKEAYGRFMRAHQSLEIMKKNGSGVIADEIFERYRKYLRVLELEKFDYTKFVYELAMGLQLSKAFFVYLEKEGEDEDIIRKKFEVILQRIKDEYEGSHFGANNLVLQNVKHFTVCLLLKLKNLSFIVMDIKGLEQVSNSDSKDIPVAKTLSVKVYYEILDNMLVLPKKCENFISLKNCLYLESNKILNYVKNKYLLKRSVSGWGLLDKITKIFKNLNSPEIENHSQNMTVFKKYFYHNLFSMLFSYKKKYDIKDSKSLDNLENKISKAIDEFKSNNGPFKLNFELIDQLDIDVYDEILEIRANFDDFVPLGKNEKAVEKITKLFLVFFSNFLEEYGDKINLKFKELVGILKKEVFLWKNEVLENHVQISDLNEFPELNQKKK